MLWDALRDRKTERQMISDSLNNDGPWNGIIAHYICIVYIIQSWFVWRRMKYTKILQNGLSLVVKLLRSPERDETDLYNSWLQILSDLFSFSLEAGKPKISQYLPCINHNKQYKNSKFYGCLQLLHLHG